MKTKVVGLCCLGIWSLIKIEGNRTPDGILQPPMELRLDKNLVAKFRKITKKNNWLYDVCEQGL